VEVDIAPSHDYEEAMRRLADARATRLALAAEVDPYLHPHPFASLLHTLNWAGSTTVIHTVISHLPKFRVLMYKGRYGAVIGYKKPTTWTCRLSSYRNASFVANHRAVFSHVLYQRTQNITRISKHNTKFCHMSL
jgi:hypothetical protein